MENANLDLDITENIPKNAKPDVKKGHQIATSMIISESISFSP
jgi:hypothetical protein